jgi:hypothetical protein
LVHRWARGELEWVGDTGGNCHHSSAAVYLEQIGEENLFSSKGEALFTLYQRLDRDVCRRCTWRIFRECQGSTDLPSGTPEGSVPWGRIPEPHWSLVEVHRVLLQALVQVSRFVAVGSVV